VSVFSGNYRVKIPLNPDLVPTGRDHRQPATAHCQSGPHDVNFPNGVALCFRTPLSPPAYTGHQNYSGPNYGLWQNSHRVWPLWRDSSIKVSWDRRRRRFSTSPSTPTNLPSRPKPSRWASAVAYGWATMKACASTSVCALNFAPWKWKSSLVLIVDGRSP